jgi:hypothetical protein
MKIQIDLDRRSVRVLDHEVFTDLRAQASCADPAPAAVDRILRDEHAGTADETHAHLGLAWLERAAEVHARGTTEQFARMVAYAAEQGWVDQRAGTVRAHLVWLPPAT